MVLGVVGHVLDRKSTRLNSSHVEISYAVFCLKKKKNVSLGLFESVIVCTFPADQLIDDVVDTKRRYMAPDTSNLCFLSFNHTATTEIYTLSLHDALPISAWALFFFEGDGDHRDLHSFPTRRSSD